jgi:hypothetical protein
MTGRKCEICGKTGIGNDLWFMIPAVPGGKPDTVMCCECHYEWKKAGRPKFPEGAKNERNVHHDSLP